MLKHFFLFTLIFWNCPLCFCQEPVDSTYFIRKISISGNTRTNETIILREMTISLGDTVGRNQLTRHIDQSKNNINNTRLFITVEITEKKIDATDVELIVNLKERWYFFVLPQVFLSDRSFNEWWYNQNHDFRRLTYGIQAKHFNLSGNNDQLSLKAYGGFVPYFELSYHRPYIDKRQRMGLRGGVYYSTQRSIAYRTWNDRLSFHPTEERSLERKGAFVEYRLRNAYYHTHILYAGYSMSQISDTIAKLNPTYFLNGTTQQQFFLASYSYIFDRRDNRQYTLKGHYFSGEITKSGIFKNDDVQLLTLGFIYNFYYPVRKNVFFDVSFRAKLSFPKTQPYNLRRGYGYYNNYVRGYDLYVIDGQHYGIIKTNFKYKLFSRTTNLSNFIKIKQFNTLPSALFLSNYIDWGYIKNPLPAQSNTALSNKHLVGGGVGFDIVTWYDTIAKVNYSINRLGEKHFFFSIVRNL